MFALIDLSVLILVAGLARAGWRRGFASQAIDLVGFTVALLLAIRFYGPVAVPYRALGASDGWAALAGGLTVFVPLIIAVAVVGAKVGRVVMQPGLHLTNRLLGIGFGVAWAAVVLTFVLLVSQFAPVPLGISDAVRRSPTARLLLSSASPATRLLQGVAERDAEKLLLYLRQSLRLLRPPAGDDEPEPPPMRFPRVAEDQVTLDAGAERDLLRLVNDERTKRNLRPVRWDDRLAGVGRDHSKDMYLRGYFAHRSPDGTSPSERLRAERIEYVLSGENLALAPTLALAHEGLMKSPGHRRNILDPDFSKLGIGIYKGPYGLMTSQEFCGGC